MTPVFSGMQHFFSTKKLILAYINESIKQKLDRNRDQQRSVRVKLGDLLQLEIGFTVLYTAFVSP